MGTIGGGAGSTALTEFSDANFHVYDNGDPTKHMHFEASGISTGTVRTLIIPNADGTIALTSDLTAGYVPYTGASGAVNLGSENLTTTGIGTIRRGVFDSANGTGAGGDAEDVLTLTSGDGAVGVEVLGSNIVINGGFATDTDWDKTGGFTISGGKATTNINSTLSPTVALNIEAGEMYVFTIDIDALFSGTTVTATLGGDSHIFTSTGSTQSVVLSAINTDDLVITYTKGFLGTCTIDNVVVKKITQSGDGGHGGDFVFNIGSGGAKDGAGTAGRDGKLLINGNAEVTGAFTAGNFSISGSKLIQDASVVADLTFQNNDLNKDIVFNVNDGGSMLPALTIKGATRAFQGYGSTATGNDSFGLGDNVRATGTGAFAVGSESSATDNGCIAFGNVVNATGNHALAFGSNGDAEGDRSMIFGVSDEFTVKATANEAIAFGRGYTNATTQSLSIGFGAKDFMFDATDFSILQNNHKIKIGTSGQLEVYFDGTDSILNMSTGDLKVTGGYVRGAYRALDGASGVSQSVTFGGAGSGDVTAMTIKNGIITNVTTLP